MAVSGAPPREPDDPFRAAVFDMDGLLIDSEPLWRRAEMDILGPLGVPLTEERCFETRGMVVGEVTAYWFERYPWEGPSPEAVADEIIDALADLLHREVVLKPGARAALASCRERGLVLAVASSSPRRLIEVVVDGLGLRPWFSVLRSAQDEKAGKPDPAVFLSTAAALGVDPRHCVVFEDSPAGVRAAHDAGMVCVAVPETGGAVSASDAEGLGLADLVIDSLEEVDDALWGRLAR
jgi:HAD superfamily hydrolase (TIGR01509 family)